MKQFFKNKLNLVLAILGVILLVIIGYFCFDIFFSNDVKAIDYKGLSENQIINWMNENGLKEDAYTFEYEYSEEIAKGICISQSIEKDTKLKDNITLVISSGLDPEVSFTIPNLKTLSEAKEFFEDKGYLNVAYEETNSNEAKDTILNIEPSGEVKRSEKIVVKYSSGENVSPDGEVIIINFIGKYSVDDATKWCKDNGLIVELVDELSDTITRNYISSQSINEGTSVKQGTSIKLGVSNGKGIEIPDVSTGTKEEFEAWAKSKDLENVEYEYVSSSLARNRIVSISPKTGTIISVDYPVKVSLSRGEGSEDEVEVPDFVGKYTLEQATKWANDNGIKLETYDELSDEIARNYISAQSIKKGSLIVKGDSIKLGVSNGKGVVIPDVSTGTKEEFEAWAKSKGLENVSYTYEISQTLPEGRIVSVTPRVGTTISVDYPVKVVISSGKTNTKIQVESGYVGKSEASFKEYITSLKLVPVDSKERYYSNNAALNTVWGYNTGLYNQNANVEYCLSLGPYTPNLNEYNAKTIQEAQNILNAYNQKKAGFTITFNQTETSDSSKINKTYDCLSSGTVIACKVGVASVPSIDANEFNGLTIQEATNKMNTYRGTYGAGSFNYSFVLNNTNVPDKTYGCIVSNKNNVVCNVARPQISIYSLTSETQITNYMNEYKNKYGVGSYSYSYVDTDNQTLDGSLVKACSIVDPNVSCQFYKYKEVAKASIMAKSMYRYSEGDNYETTANNLIATLSAFYNAGNLEISGGQGESLGRILYIGVNANNTGYNENYTPGDYPIATTKVKIIICNQVVQ